MEQQNPTKSNKNSVNRETGLTPIQEKAVILLLSGKSITDVSNELDIDRGTIYQWQGKETFQAYYNNLAGKIQLETESQIYGLYEKAITAISESLQSENENIKLKTATWVLDKIQSQTIGETDPKESIRKNCRIMDNGIELWETDTQKFHEKLKVNGLE